MNTSHSYPQTEPENIPAGILGAFLGALLGGGLYVLLYQVGFISAICGMVAVIGACWAYAFFSHRSSIRGVVIASVISLLVMVLAWYICLAIDVCKATQLLYEEGELDAPLTFFESVRAAPLFLQEGEIAGAYVRDLIISLVLCAVGAIDPVRRALAKTKAPATDVTWEQNVTETAPPAKQEDASAQSENSAEENADIVSKK